VLFNRGCPYRKSGSLVVQGSSEEVMRIKLTGRTKTTRSDSSHNIYLIRNANNPVPKRERVKGVWKYKACKGQRAYCI